ncbi:CoF synthetase [Paenibacillus sp. SC116]|nr:CoF synthetase [Paenibacillus sp. SC116]
MNNLESRVAIMVEINAPHIAAKLQEVKQLYPWYTTLLEGACIDSWPKIPLLTHDRLLPYFDETELVQEPNWNIYRTSGTSGKRRKAIGYDAADEEAYVEHKVQLFGKLLEGRGITRALSDMGTGHAAATAQEIFEKLDMACWTIPFQQPVEEHLACIAEHRPQVLYTMPSILDRLVKAAPAGFDWGIQVVILVGEVAAPAWRQRMADVFGIAAADVKDTYGSIEVGTMAYHDASIGRYVMMEGIAAEGVSPAEVGLPDIHLPEGEQVLVLTSFVRRRFPVLRYVTYDIVRDLRSEWIDGRQVTTFEAIVKRIGPELKHGEKISLYDIEDAVFKHVKQADVRVIVEHNQLHVYIDSPQPIDNALYQKIRSSLHDAIPEIGQMIDSGILEDMNVHLVNLQDPNAAPSLNHQAVKQKKLYVQE